MTSLPPLPKGCYLLEASSFKLKEQFTFEELQRITVSSLTDGVVIIRLPAEGPHARVSSDGRAFVVQPST